MIGDGTAVGVEHREILRCPTCRGDLEDDGTTLHCSRCDVEYPVRDGQVDLRLREPRSCELNFEIDGSVESLEVLEFGIDQDPSPEVDWSGREEFPPRFDGTLASHVPAPSSPDARALDLGCGRGLHRAICEHAGYEWVGIDIDSDAAPVLGDIHALPFEDDSFEFALVLGMLHLASNPFVMLEEVRRVLKPGGTLIGTVGFLEPSGAYNHYHHAPRAVFRSLETSGFTVEGVDEMGWHGLESMVRLGLFPSMPSQFVSVLVSLTLWMHRLWYRIGYLATGHYLASEEYRRVSNTSAFSFVAYNDG